MTAMTETSLPEPSFVDRDGAVITADLVAKFESALGKTLYPAQVERVLVDMLAYRETLLRIAIQEAAKQNLASYARAPMLDHLGALTGSARLPAHAARTLIEFSLPVRTDTIIIPAGTVIQSGDGGIAFATATDVAVAAGETTATVWADAVEPGGAMNKVSPGQLSVLPSPTIEGLTARNITISYAGSEAEGDEHYRSRVMLSPEREACGTISAYRLAALSVHPDILDVAVTCDAPGSVTVSASTATGAPDEGLLSLLRQALNDDAFRPLTDMVTVVAPRAVVYHVDIRLTLYPGAPGTTAGAVQTALEGYVLTLKKTLGNDLVPSRFIALAQNIAGVQAVVLASPQATELKPHEYADCTTITVTVSGVSND